MNQLILFFTVILCMTACNPEEMVPEEESWVGDWVASLVLRDDSLVQIPDTIEGFGQEFKRYITITIEEGETGFLLGKSFKNDFGMEFWLSPDDGVEFGPVEGTRVQEEEWGGAVIGNILETKFYKVDKDSLYFEDIDSRILILFTKPQ